MKRTEIINLLGLTYNYHSYLEIGVFFQRWNIDNVHYSKVVGVDPDPDARANFVMTSDDFFQQNTDSFDFIFVDGLHHSDQVYKDIMNSLKVLNPGGTIMCHDLNPQTEKSQKIPFTDGPWHGDCWKAWVKFRSEHNNYLTYCIDTDCGCGIIQEGKPECEFFISEELTYDNLVKNRQKWLNLISVEEFISRTENNASFL